MTKLELEELSGAELIRVTHSNLDVQNETSNERFTAEQLLTISRAHLRCEWDFYPDQWSARQIREALRGVVPRFKEARWNERNQIDGYVPEHLALHLHERVPVTARPRK